MFSSEYFSFLRKNKVEGKRGFFFEACMLNIGKHNFLTFTIFYLFRDGFVLDL